MPPFENLWAVAHEAIPALFSAWSAEHNGAAFERAGIGGALTSDAAYALAGNVAVVRVRGPLDRETAVSGWTGKRLSTGYGDIRSAMETAAADPSATALLLALDSPGGAVGGCKELADAIAAVAARKPVAAYADGLCASAAYWLASATGRVFAPVTAQVGSIGVVMIHADFSHLNEKMGVSYSYITGGEWKAVGNKNAPLSPESRAYLQQRVNALHSIFRADVARNMGLDPSADACAWGDGQIFLAQEAQRLGLVSAIVTGMEEAIHILAQETHMDKKTLAAQHPELLAQIEAEAKESAAKEAAALQQQAVAKAQADTLALVRTLVGEDAEAKIESVLKAGVNPDQLAALAPLFAAQNTAQPDKGQSSNTEASTRAALLAALTAATPPPLPDAGGKTTDKSEGRAAVDRMSRMEA
ncbi:signal peptide peptidase SppA, 36K type [Desulfovibrio sp. 3_1_syn3]|uniref:S49 family peptidase n=1 Tax=Desulfovibrio sp. 3_1_syn3 TaxID=457398 RepID=UPI0002DA6BD5|nr:S49 family peptidase [Desulfovibrio sp. 3_1_syn3]EFL85829.2 signal peptide peptidase SppA, 36K type [Desulfovibrio sp. 3_1_syn3]